MTSQRLGGTRVGIFCFPGHCDPFPTRCRNKDKHSPLAIRTGAFGRIIFVRVASLAFRYGESSNLAISRLDLQGGLVPSNQLRLTVTRAFQRVQQLRFNVCHEKAKCVLGSSARRLFGRLAASYDHKRDLPNLQSDIDVQLHYD